MVMSAGDHTTVSCLADLNLLYITRCGRRRKCRKQMIHPSIGCNWEVGSSWVRTYKSHFGRNRMLRYRLGFNACGTWVPRLGCKNRHDIGHTETSLRCKMLTLRCAESSELEVGGCNPPTPALAGCNPDPTSDASWWQSSASVAFEPDANGCNAFLSPPESDASLIPLRMHVALVHAS